MIALFQIKKFIPVHFVHGMLEDEGKKEFNNCKTESHPVSIYEIHAVSLEKDRYSS